MWQVIMDVRLLWDRVCYYGIGHGGALLLDGVFYYRMLGYGLGWNIM